MTHQGVSRSALVLCFGFVLSACGGGGSHPATVAASGGASTTVSGAAATGAAMPNANIELHCRNNWIRTTTTDNAGQWSQVVPQDNLPCAVQASDGSQTFYSFTIGNGSAIVTNVTPLTSLALAQTGTLPDSTWFSALNDAALQSFSGNLTGAIADLKTKLETKGYSLPANFNPLTTPLTPATNTQAGNDHDRLLDDLKTAQGSSSFDDLLTSVAQGGDLPEPPSVDYAEPLTATGAGSDLLAILDNLTGEYHLKVTEVFSEGASAGADTVFPMNSVHTVKIGRFPPVSIATDARELQYDSNVTYTRSGSGANEVLTINLGGRFSSMGAVVLEYHPGTGHLILYPSGFKNREGTATLESKQRSLIAP